MSKIKIFIVDNHQIVSDGICSLLSDVKDIAIEGYADDLTTLIEKIKGCYIHIVLVNMYKFTDEVIEKIREVKNRFPKTNFLILSMSKNEEFILKTLKAGAKGYLTKDTNRSELIEAIYTIRSGYDYYAKQISTIILKNYLKNTDPEYLLQEQKDKSISNREMDVLKLFGQSYTNKEIAEKLFISTRTVESHKTNIMKKLNLKTTVDLIKFVIKNDIVEI